MTKPVTGKYHHDHMSIVETSDGSHTVYVPQIDEHYHSVHGAVQESMIVFIQNGYEFLHQPEINVLEIGFGTGLNAFLTLLRAEKDKKKISYTSVEKYPLPQNIWSLLNYGTLAGDGGDELFSLLHEAEWNRKIEITRYFTLYKLKADISEIKIKGEFHLVYFDAFAPGKQPELWTDSIFSMISEATVRGGVLVTYSSKGAVKRSLTASGFRIERLPGPPGKREVLRAVKI